MAREFEHVRDNIRKYRIMRMMTQETLASASELSVSYIAQIESNRKSIGFEGLCKIAAALDVSIGDLFEKDCSVHFCEMQIEQSFAKLLSDCTENEKRIIYETARQLKISLRKEDKGDE